MLKNILRYMLPVFAVVTMVALPACRLSDVYYESQSPLTLPETFIGDNASLAEHIWRLVEITHQGEDVEFEAIAPVTISFKNNGYLYLWRTNCAAGARYKLSTGSEQHYRLISGGDSSLAQCGEPRDLQRARVGGALKATNRYEIRDDRLLLTGEEVQMVFEIDRAD